MGCDYFTDEQGELDIKFHDYETGKIVFHVWIKTEKANHPISIDLIKGRAR